MTDHERPWDTCLVCGADYTTLKNGTIRVHGPRNRRCPGSNNVGARYARITKDLYLAIRRGALR